MAVHAMLKPEQKQSKCASALGGRRAVTNIYFFVEGFEGPGKE
jgi:hypothetical protein